MALRRVLVVDDDEDIRTALGSLLELNGYDVVEAKNGLEGLEAMQVVPRPSLVILDLMMPVMSGWEFLEQVREHDEMSRVPIIVVSAMCAPGVERCIQKPVNFVSLLESVQEICARTSTFGAQPTA